MRRCACYPSHVIYVAYLGTYSVLQRSTLRFGTLRCFPGVHVVEPSVDGRPYLTTILQHSIANIRTPMQKHAASSKQRAQTVWREHHAALPAFAHLFEAATNAHSGQGANAVSSQTSAALPTNSAKSPSGTYIAGCTDVKTEPGSQIGLDRMSQCSGDCACSSAGSGVCSRAQTPVELVRDGHAAAQHLGIAPPSADAVVAPQPDPCVSKRYQRMTSLALTPGVAVRPDHGCECDVLPGVYNARIAAMDLPALRQAVERGELVLWEAVASGCKRKPAQPASVGASRSGGGDVSAAVAADAEHAALSPELGLQVRLTPPLPPFFGS